MDTMTLTKAAGGLIGALLVFLLGQWAAEALYHVESHGEAAYVIETDEEEGADEEEEVSFAQLMADADPDSGARVFKKCAACHKLEKGENSTGPYLYGVVGREVASADGFGYSDPMKAHGGEWTPEELSEFLAKPSAVVPGTSMSFAGLNKVGDRVDVIAYLNDHSDEPYDIAAAADDGAADGAAEEEPAAEDAADDATDDSAAASDEGATEEDATESQATEDEAATEEVPAEDVTATEDETATEDDAATQDAPAEDTPAEDTPAEDTADEPAPAEEGGADDQAALEAEDAPADETAAEATPAAASGMLADADVEKGEKVFKKCAACHKLEEGKNVVGPYLYGVVGRPVASAEGFNYTDAMKEYGGDWTPERLDAYLAKPRDVVPGTSMSFAGLRKEEERINVIGYLDSLGD